MLITASLVTVETLWVIISRWVTRVTRRDATSTWRVGITNNHLVSFKHSMFSDMPNQILYSSVRHKTWTKEHVCVKKEKKKMLYFIYKLPNWAQISSGGSGMLNSADGGCKSDGSRSLIPSALNWIGKWNRCMLLFMMCFSFSNFVLVNYVHALILQTSIYYFFIFIWLGCLD